MIGRATSLLEGLYARTPGAEAWYSRLAPLAYAVRDRRLSISRLRGPTPLVGERGSVLLADSPLAPAVRPSTTRRER